MKKQGMILLMVVGLLVSSLACTVTFPSVTVDVDVETVHGSGQVTEETREVSGFSRVTLAGFGNLYIERGETESLRIEAEDNLIDYITAEVRGDELEIGWQKGIMPITTKSINYYLTVKELDTITLDGAGSIEAPDMRADTFRVVVNGAGDFDLKNLDADTFEVDLSGAGNVKVSGQVRKQVIAVNALGGYEADDLDSETATVKINGAGSATVRVSESLDAEINGAGSVHYYGSPSVTKQINGIGDVSKAGD